MDRNQRRNLRYVTASGRKFQAWRVGATFDSEVLTSVKPNEGFGMIYRRKLDALIKAMQSDIMAEIDDVYRDREDEIAMDDSPAMALRGVMSRMATKWQRAFNDASLDLAKFFAQGVAQRTDASLKAILKKGGFTVEFKLSKSINNVIQASVGENVALIKSIASQHLADVEGMVMRSVQAGRDMHTLSVDLKKRYDITTRRAALIARDQNNKATSQIARARQLQLGITEGIWRHSGAGHEPRPDHVAFSGKRFNLKEGALISGSRIWPGELINCKCTWSPVIPGLD